MQASRVSRSFIVHYLHLLELIVVALVLLNLLVLEVQDLFADAVQKVLVMAHYQQSLLPSL